jgi:hypothetical protein
MPQQPPPEILPLPADAEPSACEDAIELARHFAGIAREVFGQLARGEAPASARGRILRWMLVPAESLLRRVIALLAASLPPPASRPRAAAPQPPPIAPRAPATDAAPARPRFRLTEPAPRRHTPWVRPMDAPRVSIAGLSPPPAPPPARKAPDTAHLLARLGQRLAALEAALDDPLREARRLRRRLARARSSRKASAPLRPLLSFRAIPGLASPGFSPEARGLLDWLNREAFARLAALPDTS